MRNCIIHMLLLAFCLLPTWVQAGAGSCVTADCHSQFGSAEVVHAPVAHGECSLCHRVDQDLHPDGGSVSLSTAEPQLCLDCHDNPADGAAHVHTAVKNNCTGCHNPHEGPVKGLVVETGSKLCKTCHEDIFADQAAPPDANQGGTFFTKESGGLELLRFNAFPGQEEDTWPDYFGSQFKHGPAVAGSCVMCHTHHGGDDAAMMKLPGNTFCLACHPGIKETIDNSLFQHEPVANGRCWDCHTAHASDFKPLLRARYPRDFYAPFKVENYALCFNCHNKTAFVYEYTTEATAFRNQNMNLHYFHVNRTPKGRVCKSCHGVHGANQVSLLMSEVPGFGKWEIPLHLKEDQDGGTCYVGCHRPKSYNRKSFVDNL
jgi:predicted CXXCH cytochrome family protein